MTRRVVLEAAKPISCDTRMIQGLISRQVTMTCRLVKPQPSKNQWFNSAARENYIARTVYLGKFIKESARVWDSAIVKKEFPIYGWEANPWVWRYEFEVQGLNPALCLGKESVRGDNCNVIQ